MASCSVLPPNNWSMNCERLTCDYRPMEGVCSFGRMSRGCSRSGKNWPSPPARQISLTEVVNRMPRRSDLHWMSSGASRSRGGCARARQSRRSVTAGLA